MHSEMFSLLNSNNAMTFTDTAVRQAKSSVSGLDGIRA